jgi:peptidoglycan/xylan/chitin deacetylase (PgdA/CDA1 family)
MLNFRNTIIFFFITFTVMLVADIILPVSGWLYVGIILALLGLLTWGSICIRSGFYLRSVCFGNRNSMAVTLTFDDGPDGMITPMILDILKENNVKATFFIVGNRAERYPEILKRIDSEGHIIGGHSYSHHFFFDLFSVEKMKHEMKRTSDIVFSATGKRIHLFRPPYGVTNPAIAKAIKAMHYLSIGWSLKSRDTVIRDDTLLLNRLISNLNQGDIVLFHDNKPWIVNLLKVFIPCLKERGYAIDRLDKFLNINAYVF